ncbi:MAG: lysylphosphatidylglycerol synthase transmembrane domain-containing protein [Candidatus Bathyarchaeia archaeon]
MRITRELNTMDFRARLLLLSLIGASILVLLLVHVGVSGIASALRGAYPSWILAALTLDLAFYILKAVRWRRILEDMALQIPYITVLKATFIGYLTNMLVPFRLGELGRAYALKKGGGAPLSLTILSMAVESLFDTMGIGFILGLSLLLMAESSALNAAVLRALKLLGYGGVALSLILLAAPRINILKRLGMRLIGVLPDKIRRRLEPLTLNYYTGLAGLSRRGMDLILLWGLSTLLWVIPGLCTAAFFKAFKAGLAPAKALLGSMLLQISFAAPAPPGYAGTFEAYWTLIYRLLGCDAVEALEVGVAYHLFNLITATTLGGLSMLWLNLTLTKALQLGSPGVGETS